MRTDEAAAYLGLSKSLIYNAVYEGKLHPRKIPGKTCPVLDFDQEDLDAYRTWRETELVSQGATELSEMDITLGISYYTDHGWNIAKLRDFWQVSQDRCRQLLLDNGVTIRPKPTKSPAPTGDLLSAGIRGYQSGKLSLKTLALLWHTNYNRARAILVSNGVAIRPPKSSRNRSAN